MEQALKSSGFDEVEKPRYNATAMETYFGGKDSVYEPEITSDEAVFSDLEEAEGTFAERLRKLKAELKICQSERKEYLNGWQRAKADYLNSKKRFDEERLETGKRAEIRFIEKLLPLADSFSLALEGLKHGKETAGKTADPWQSGMLQIHAQLTSLLKDLGVSDIEAMGSVFDPHIHEALSSQTVDDAKAHNTVIAVLQKGYLYRDTLLRPAKVIIGTHTS